MSGNSNNRVYQSGNLSELEDRLRYREDMLDRWERDLRCREDALLEGRVPQGSYRPRNNGVGNNPRHHNATNRRRTRRRDIDYSMFALRVPGEITGEGDGASKPSPSPDEEVSSVSMNTHPPNENTSGNVN